MLVEMNCLQVSFGSSRLLIPVFQTRIPACNCKTGGIESGQHPAKSASVRKGLSSPNEGSDPLSCWVSEQQTWQSS